MKEKKQDIYIIQQTTDFKKSASGAGGAGAEGAGAGGAT
jgi:hypothetical protein